MGLGEPLYPSAMLGNAPVANAVDASLLRTPSSACSLLSSMRISECWHPVPSRERWRCAAAAVASFCSALPSHCLCQRSTAVVMVGLGGAVMPFLRDGSVAVLLRHGSIVLALWCSGCGAPTAKLRHDTLDHRSPCVSGIGAPAALLDSMQRQRILPVVVVSVRHVIR
eukprot:7957735-Alexandrium_andersonii.AAC.1